ncbi:hypothetical protein DICPUDRAFT_153460 [Dictyostelium purpureum]|uniref:Uncharacterized protein n=1 Tax=Dictyostelium purpureum TaxID=5786 RepID=F0ZNZ2_DICPU|nr:uncharacterized protein DICPUDRAFT_153460 [Dictyostelium purpureum]EGC34336.1 hypothetical protein DICPUDRAFT_153460 [Dictyostelium purpureum]|eukprot:XP_003289129.1 hypothetical protein DICPUDRAFT_153460 [Dictyostelium purpureum]
MGLISLVFDCIVISSACAGARRMTGFNVGQKVVDMVKNEKALTFTKGFFNVGEWVVDKGVNYARRKIIQNNLNEFKETMKPTSTNLQQHNTYSHQHHQNNQYMPPSQNQNQNQNQQQQPPQQQNEHNQQYRF